MIILSSSGGGHGWILQSTMRGMIMGNLGMLCACGRAIHVGTLVYWAAGHEQTSAVVASVRVVDAMPERTDVYPALPAREAMLALTVLVTGTRGGVTLGVGEYVTLIGVTPVVSGCGDSLPSLPARA